MRTLKRVAAIVCSATVLAAVSVTAFIANAQETVPMKDRTSELTAGKANIVADQVYAQPGEKISYSLYVTNNTGFAISGLALYYDSRLDAVQNDELTEIDPVFDTGEITALKGGQNLYQFASLNETVSVVSAGTIGNSNATTEEGKYITFYFNVPSDAKPGDIFPMDVQITRWLDYEYTSLSYVDVDGWVKIPDETETESTTSSSTTSSTTTSSTTTSSTTTSSTTTSSTTTSSTTTSDTTTSSTTTSDTTTSSTTTSDTTTSSTTTSDTTTSSTTTSDTTTSSTTTSDTTTSSTTTSDTTTSSDTTSTSTESTTSTSESTDTKPNETSDNDRNTTLSTPKNTGANPDKVPGTTKATGAKTGDAGIGAAVAALLVAVGAATVSAVKRKDH